MTTFHFGDPVMTPRNSLRVMKPERTSPSSFARRTLRYFLPNKVSFLLTRMVLAMPFLILKSFWLLFCKFLEC